MKLLLDARINQQFLTGLIYVNPEKENFLELLDLVDEPLASLPAERIRPPKEALDDIMEGYQ